MEFAGKLKSGDTAHIKLNYPCDMFVGDNIKITVLSPFVTIKAVDKLPKTHINYFPILFYNFKKMLGWKKINGKANDQHIHTGG
jgi:hypothetical protein